MIVHWHDLPSRGEQHPAGRRETFITHVIVDHWRRDPLVVPPDELAPDRVDRLASKTYPELMRAAIVGTHQAYENDGRPTADLHLPAVDESSLGQFFQMMLLATVVEGHLMGINPDGESGAEPYQPLVQRDAETKWPRS
jgi:glucose-6-phosphate isomerase